MKSYMSEIQKNNITRLLKQKRKTKRELAEYLSMHENGMNRLLGNRNISMKKLERIATFLEMDINELIKQLYAEEEETKKENENGEEGVAKVNEPEPSQELILLLSDVIKGQKQIQETLERNEKMLSTVMDLLIKFPEK